MKQSPCAGFRARALRQLLFLLAVPVMAQQASITLQNSDVAYCYKQEANWTLTKTNNSGYPSTVKAPGDTVNWTVSATRGADGPKQLCAIGFVTVTNTGTAPATIGNIVVDLQRNLGQPAKWTVISADVADATNGDAATSDKIVAGALQGQTTYPGSIVSVAGVAATFTENAISGSLSFTDASSNTIWAIKPQQTIPVGGSVSLFFNAVFNVNSITFAPNEQLRTEVFVSFGNAGARGGSGSTATNIDINGNGKIDSDEANVRTVPTRITKALPTLQICNNSVTVIDTFSTGTATVSLSADPIGAGQTITSSQNYVLTGTVGGSGTLANTAELKGTGSTVTLTLGTDPSSGLPITTTRDCCVAVDLTANSNVIIVAATLKTTSCSYTKGGYAHRGVPGDLFTSNFISVFSPNGLTIGVIGSDPIHDATWQADSAGQSALQSYLNSPAGATSGALTADIVNATSTSGGALPEQTAVLTVNVQFGNANLFTPNSGIGGLTLFGTGTSLDGYTVSTILGVANTAVGTGVLPGGYSFGDLNTLITKLNESWDNCTQSDWAVTHLQ